MTRVSAHPCDFPGCTRPARVLNDGGLFCEVPHRSTARMVREYAIGLVAERWQA